MFMETDNRRFSPGEFSRSPFSPPAVATIRRDRNGANTRRCLQRIRSFPKRSSSSVFSGLVPFWVWLSKLDPNWFLLLLVLVCVGCLGSLPSVYTCHSPGSHPNSPQPVLSFCSSPFSVSNGKWQQKTLPSLRAQALKDLELTRFPLPCLRYRSNDRVVRRQEQRQLRERNMLIAWCSLSNTSATPLTTFPLCFRLRDSIPQSNLTSSPKLLNSSELIKSRRLPKPFLCPGRVLV